MKISDVKKNAFAMPLTSPSYPPGPYRFVNREFLVITYRTDPDALSRVLPEPLTFDEPLVKYEFIRMPDSTASATTPSPVRSFPASSTASPAAMSIPCSSTTTRPLPAVVRSGASRRNSPNRRCPS